MEEGLGSRTARGRLRQQQQAIFPHREKSQICVQSARNPTHFTHYTHYTSLFLNLVLYSSPASSRQLLSSFCLPGNQAKNTSDFQIQHSPKNSSPVLRNPSPAFTVPLKISPVPQVAKVQPGRIPGNKKTWLTPPLPLPLPLPLPTHLSISPSPFPIPHLFSRTCESFPKCATIIGQYASHIFGQSFKSPKDRLGRCLVSR